MKCYLCRQEIQLDQVFRAYDEDACVCRRCQATKEDYETRLRFAEEVVVGKPWERLPTYFIPAVGPSSNRWFYKRNRGVEATWRMEVSE